MVGLTLGEAEALAAGSVRLSVIDGDPVSGEAIVVAHEPGGGSSVPAGAVVGLRTAIVGPSLCSALGTIPTDDPSFAGSEERLDDLRRARQHAFEGLQDDIDTVLAAYTSPDQEDRYAPAVARAIDRILIHRRACDFVS